MNQLNVYLFKTLIALSVLTFTPAILHSEEISRPKPPDLVGVWRLVDLQVFQAGNKSWDESSVAWRIHIKEQVDAMTKGIVAYHSTTYKGHDGNSETSERQIEFLGTISWSGDEVNLVTVGEADGSIYRGNIVNENMIEWVMYETGEHGWIGRAIAVRD